MVTKEKFGRRLQEARHLRHLTQKALADQIGIKAPSVAGFETGSSWPHVTTLIKLASALHVSADYLCGFTDDPEAHHDVPEPFGAEDLSPDLLRLLQFAHRLTPVQREAVTRLMESMVSPPAENEWLDGQR